MTRARLRRWCVGLLWCAGLTVSLCAEENKEVTLYLKSGDRLTGEVLSEDDERIVLSTSWNIAIYVPKSEVDRQVASVSFSDTNQTAAVSEPSPKDGNQSQPAPSQATETAKPAVLATAKPLPAKAPSPKKPTRWKWNLKLGTDLTQGAKDRTIYFGETALTYTRNYEQNPKKFLRNRTEYRVNYGEINGEVSANQMVGANKLDFDIGAGYYGYAALGAGYDTVRKIDYQYDLGPGVGYHLVAEKTVVLDVELGFAYQYREGLNGAPNREVIQSRIGQELTWEVVPKITLTQQAAFLPFLDNFGEYQVRFQGNLGFGIVRHLSLNLTVLNFYDTLPAPGVPNNEFQFRSSLGVNF